MVIGERGGRKGRALTENAGRVVVTQHSVTAARYIFDRQVEPGIPAAI